MTVGDLKVADKSQTQNEIRYMFIDMHCHSVSSDDARATAEQYLKWIQVLRRRGHQVDGIVLTEHRKFDREADYSALARPYDVLVLKGSELDTRYGHVLVYGVNDQLLQMFDFSDVTIDTQALIHEARRSGAMAVPAHPGRFGVGLVDHIANGAILEGLEIIEQLNFGSRDGEDARASDLSAQLGLWGIGGSDAHFTSAIGSCVTDFQDSIHNETDLVAALASGRFQAVRMEGART